MLPDARLVLQLRDPVERAYSDYKMYYRRGLAREAPETYLRTPENDYPRFLLEGLYGQHLRNWLDYFPKEQILAFRFEEVKVRPRAIVEMVSRHIGIEPFFDQALAEKSENDSKARILPLPVRTLLAPLKKTVKPLRGRTWFEGARSLLAREIAYPPLSDELRAHLADFYRDDMALAETMLGIDLSDWRRKHEQGAKAKAA